MMIASRLLRVALAADAIATSAMALLMVSLSTTLERVLALPASLLFYVGLALIPYGIVVGMLATRPLIHRALVWTVVAANVVWTIDSILVLALGWLAPNAWGAAFVIAQAAAVAVLVELQYLGWRRSSAIAGGASGPLHTQRA